MTVIEDGGTWLKQRLDSGVYTWLISPFVGRATLTVLLKSGAWPKLNVGFRLPRSLDDAMLLDTNELRRVLNVGGKLVAVPRLHAKVYMLGDQALVTSGNMTQPGLSLITPGANIEVGLSVRDRPALAALRAWRKGLPWNPVTAEDLDKIDAMKQGGQPDHLWQDFSLRPLEHAGLKRLRKAGWIRGFERVPSGFSAKAWRLYPGENWPYSNSPGPVMAKLRCSDPESGQSSFHFHFSKGEAAGRAKDKKGELGSRLNYCVLIPTLGQAVLAPAPVVLADLDLQFGRGRVSASQVRRGHRLSRLLENTQAGWVLRTGYNRHLAPVELAVGGDVGFQRVALSSQSSRMDV